MPYPIDRIKDTSTTTGTGTVTVSGSPPDGYRAFSVLAVGQPIDYTISGQSGTEYEVGRGIVASGTTFTRNQVIESSNSNALVNFSSGTKDVFVTLSGLSINTRGRVLATPYALR